MPDENLPVGIVIGVGVDHPVEAFEVGFHFVLVGDEFGIGVHPQVVRAKPRVDTPLFRQFEAFRERLSVGFARRPLRKDDRQVMALGERQNIINELLDGNPGP